jgi:hypothetical protein
MRGKSATHPRMNINDAVKLRNLLVQGDGSAWSPIVYFRRRSK